MTPRSRSASAVASAACAALCCASKLLSSNRGIAFVATSRRFASSSIVRCSSTPIYAMTQKLSADGAAFELHYAGRSRRQLAFRDELANTAFAHLHCDDEHGGALLDLAGVIARAPQGSHFYCCGPTPMLEAFRLATAAIPQEQVHFEYFSPKEEASTAGGFIVQLARSNLEVLIPLANRSSRRCARPGSLSILPARKAFAVCAKPR